MSLRDFAQTVWSATTTAVADMIYRLGRLDRATQHYQPPATSGDVAALGAADLMHRRARDQVRNNPHARKACDTWQDLIVGTGLQTLADPFEPWLDITTMTPEDLDERLAYALESDELFAEWFNDAAQFSVDGRLTGPAFQAMIVSELVNTGNVFVLECWRDRPDAVVPLCYQLIEWEHLDRTVNVAPAEGVNRVVDGIELDSDGREVAYYLYVEHPYGPHPDSVRSERIPATRCKHIVRYLRPSQHHGVTWMHASGQPEIDSDKFVSSILQKETKQAQVALVWKKKNPRASAMGLADSTSATDDNGNPVIKLSPSAHAVVIGADDSVELVESKGQGASVDALLKVLDRRSAAGMGLSYYSLTGDYEATAYASVRAAKQDEDAHVKPLQQWFGAEVAMPIRKRFNMVAAALNRFTTVDWSEFIANKRRYQRFEAMGPGRDWLDPEAETNAAIGRLRAGLSNLKLECAKRGLHWVRVLRQCRLENQLLSVLGIVLDFSKGQGGQVTQSTRDGSQSQQQQQGNNA